MPTRRRIAFLVPLYVVAGLAEPHSRSVCVERVSFRWYRVSACYNQAEEPCWCRNAGLGTEERKARAETWKNRQLVQMMHLQRVVDYEYISKLRTMSCGIEIGFTVLSGYRCLGS